MAEANKKPTLDHNSTANAQYDVAANDQDGRKMSKQLTSIGEDEYGNAIPELPHESYNAAWPRCPAMPSSLLKMASQPNIG